MFRKFFTKEYLLSKKFILGTTIAGAFSFFIVGIVFWGGFNTAMEATNTMKFCIGCHEMKNNVYEEYKPTIHYSNRTGVRASCSDCHVPDPWVHKVVRKIQATGELYHKALGSVDTPEKFNAKRLTLAKRVWKAMKDTDSRECRNCHNLESMNPEYQRPRARAQHLNAFKTGQTCIDCHKGIAHKNVRDQLTDAELEALEAPDPRYIRDIPDIFSDGLARVTAKEEKEAAQALADKKAAKELEAARIKAAVEEALAGQGGGEATASASSINVDWSKAATREITIFYPGEASIEWVLNGKFHGGSRPFDKGGERCTTCHDKETADMGAKIVSGEKAESSPIPGKRGSIPVTVEATHDADNLYMKFSWPDTAHAPVPFVEGGKMDPENQVKLALMFATDDVEYADRGGCWSTCHHDAKNMPHAPTQDTLNASSFADRIDFTNGVSKYLKESRTKIETKGRRGKKLGGWDKLKSAEDIQVEKDADKFMDIVRYSVGTSKVEDGHILDSRQMAGGQGAEFEAKLNAGTWIVVMKRPLKSDKLGDISLELGKVYNFGFAIHDDFTLSRFHHVSLGYKLGFDNETVEVNVKKQ